MPGRSEGFVGIIPAGTVPRINGNCRNKINIRKIIHLQMVLNQCPANARQALIHEAICASMTPLPLFARFNFFFISKGGQ
jgi:hypothetical protein